MMYLIGDQLGFGGFAGVLPRAMVLATAGATIEMRKVDIKRVPGGADLAKYGPEVVSAWEIRAQTDTTAAGARRGGGGVRGRRRAAGDDGLYRENLDPKRPTRAGRCSEAAVSKSSTMEIPRSLKGGSEISAAKSAPSSTTAGKASEIPENLRAKKGGGRGLVVKGCPESKIAKKLRSVEAVHSGRGLKGRLKKFARVNQGKAGAGVGTALTSIPQSRDSENLAGTSVRRKTKRNNNGKFSL